MDEIHKHCGTLKVTISQMDCVCGGFLQTVKSFNWVAIFRIEKSGRGGKTVTVIDGLPKQEIFLRELCKELKNKCGSGGTYSLDKKDGIIEIQGDKRDQIKEIFVGKNFKFKGM